MHKPSFISISGVAGAGKTTLSGYLQQYFRREQYTINAFSFANPLKSALCGWFDWDRQRLDSDFAYKEGSILDDGSPDPYCQALGMTRRVIMQKFGTECMRQGLHKDFWVIMADLGLKLGKIEHSDIFTIEDCRFLNELQWAKSIDAYRILIVRVERQHGEDPAPTAADIKSGGVTLTTSTTHPSEKEFLDWDGYDEILINLIDHNVNQTTNFNRLITHLHNETIPAICQRFNLNGHESLLEQQE
jgi:hypothetical protein